jgi:hypothetical protein
MSSKIIRRSSVHSIGWFILFAVQFALGVILLSSNSAVAGSVLSVSAVVFFILMLKGLTNPIPRIVMDDEGVTATEFNGVKIRWSDIQKVNIVRLPRLGRIITLELSDESKYIAKLMESQRTTQKINRLSGLTAFSIMAEGLDIPPGKLYDEILDYIAHTASR